MGPKKKPIKRIIKSAPFHATIHIRSANGQTRRAKHRFEYRHGMLVEKKNNTRFGSPFTQSQGHITEEPNQSQFVDQTEERATANQPTARSRYDMRKEKEVEAWMQSREVLLESFGKLCIPEKKVCSVCGVVCLIPVRCLDCGPHAQWCPGCAIESHVNRPFHRLEKWTGSIFGVMEQASPLLKCVHECEQSKRLHPVLVVSLAGHLISCMVEGCHCVTLAQSLLEHRLWPSSIHSPRVAFSLEFLRQAEVFMLEGRLSLKSFCLSMKWKNTWSDSQFQLIYRLLTNECFEEFRHASYKLRTLSFLDKDIDDGSICPACSKDPDKPITVAFDGNFGLVRKKSAGKSFEKPKHGNRMFLPDEDVLAAEGSKDDHLKSQDCSSFQAGDKLRAKNRSRKLDVTGVFGAICKHEVPLLFLEMHQGERLAYPYHLLKEIVSKSDRKIHLLYDIACKFDSYLQKCDANLRRQISLAIPIFHCYGHQMSCQMTYSPRLQENFGFVDGEDTERLWSYLRPFSPILKEMTPSHRVDLMTDLLLHYCHRKKTNMGRFLVDKLKAMEKEHDNLSSKIFEFSTLHKVPMNQEILKKWEIEERSVIELKKKANRGSITMEEKYVIQLKKLAILQDVVNSNPENMEKTLELRNVRTGLEKMEKRMKLPSRWNLDENRCVRIVEQLQAKQKFDKLQVLNLLARDRLFLLSLKERYATGQDIAYRLSRQVQSLNSKIKKSLSILNSMDGQSIAERDAFDPMSDLYSVITPQVQSGLPSVLKRQGAELLNRFNRVSEEIFILKEEMNNVCLYYISQHAVISKGLKENHGKTYVPCLLSMKLAAIENEYLNLDSQFREHITVPPMSYEFPDVTRIPLDDDDDDDVEELDAPLYEDSDSDDE